MNPELKVNETKEKLTIFDATNFLIRDSLPLCNYVKFHILIIPSDPQETNIY